MSVDHSFLTLLPDQVQSSRLFSFLRLKGAAHGEAVAQPVVCDGETMIRRKLHRRRTLSRPAILAGPELLEPRRMLSVVFQADFSGSGAGVGTALDMVTYGGSGTTLAAVGGNMTAAIAASPRLADGAGSFLRVTDTGPAPGAVAGAQFTFDSAANSPDDWFISGGSTEFDTVNGAFDFFFRTSNASANWGDGSGTDFEPFDICGYSAGQNGLGLVLNSPAANQMQLELKAVNNAGTTVQDLVANTGTVSNLILANTVYHIAGTLSTDPNGVVTISLFLAPGNTPIDTSSSTYLVAQASSNGTFDPVGDKQIYNAFNTATDGMLLGKASNIDGASQTEGFDTFRIYNVAPETFAAMTAPPPTIILQADFSGTGTGTGAGNLVSLGATGSLVSAPNATAAQSDATQFVTPDSGGYLHIADTGVGMSAGAGVDLVPLSAATSPDSWYSDGGSATYDTLNGAFDFFFRSR